MKHAFDTALEFEELSANRRRLHTSPDYWNMVSPYGGITAAAMMQGMLDRPERRGTPLSFTINYLAPITEGDYVVESELLRANRSNQHWAIRLRQGSDDAVMAQAIAICALRREVWSQVEARRPDVPPASACPPAPPRKPTGFLQRYEFRIVRGRPFADNGDSISHVWVSDSPPRALDFASLTALCDSFLPRIFLRREEFVPIGTVTMNVYFHTGAEALIRHGDAPLLAVAEGQAFSDGHFDHHGHLWGADDTLFATTHQLVWYKE